MARFYDGQPVVCVWGIGEWDPALGTKWFPEKGTRYVVSYTVSDENAERVVLQHYEGSRWNENGFAPITDISELQKLQHVVNHERELEDV